MKIVKIVIPALLVLGILVFVKIKFFPNDLESKGAVKNQLARKNSVTVFVAHNQNFREHIISTGTAIANEEALLMPEVSGKVVKLYFSEGSFVKKNQLLVKINDEELKAQLDKIELQISLSEQMEERQKKLLDINGVSQEGYDVASNQVKTLKADRQYLQAQLRKTEIRAPFDGVIGLRNISEGTFVTPSVSVAAIQQLTPIKIDFSIPEKYAGLIRKGDPINVTTEGVNKVFNAQVYAIEPKIDPATRSLKIRALCYDHQNRLLPGAFVKVEMQKESSTSILVPTEALIAEMKGYKVFFYKNGKAVSGTVTAGTRTDKMVLIKQGIQAGDTIITSGIMQLRNEAPVQIIEPTTPN